MVNVLLVLPSVSPSEPGTEEIDLGFAYGIVTRLVQTFNLTVLLTRETDLTKYELSLDKNFGHRIKVLSQTEINDLRSKPQDKRLIDYRPFVARAMDVCEHLTQFKYDCAIFDVFDAAGFVSIRAKRTGLGLDNTRLISWLRTCHEFQRGQLLESQKTFDPFLLTEQVSFAERYCCENCDLVIPQTETILNWALHEQWRIDQDKVTLFAELETRLKSSQPIVVRSIETPEHDQDVRGIKHSPHGFRCVAHFNDGQNLRHLLLSLKENDYPNFEVVVVDDGIRTKCQFKY